MSATQLLLLLAALGGSPEPLTLERLLDEVAARAPAVQVGRASVELAESRVGVAGAWEDPQLGVMAENLPLRREEDPHATPMPPMINWRLSQKLNLWGTRGLGKESARAGAQAERENLRRAEWDARAEAVMGFYDLWMNNEVGKVLDAQLELMRQMKEAARGRYVAGMMMAHHDVLRATSELARMQAQRDTLADERVARVVMLNTLRGVPPETPISEAYLPDREPLPPLEQLVARAARRPEVTSMERMTDQMRAEAALARKMYLPMVMVEGFYQQTFNGMGDMFGGGVALSVPLWFFDRQRGEVQMADAMVRRTERQVEAMRAMTEAELRAAWSRARAAERALEALERSALPSMRETVESDRSGYVTGGASFLNVLESLTALRELQMQHLEAIVRREVSRFELLRLIGAPLEEKAP